MKEVATIGLDVAKDVFQAHGADVDGAPLFNRRLRRAEVLSFFEKLPRCLVGLEACSTAHHWARSIADLGHDVKLIHPLYVKPFVKRGKTDANDAEAINEALTRKTMRFVPIKTVDQQGSVMIFRTRSLLLRQRSQAVNSLRSHLGELGITSKRGFSSVKTLTAAVRDDNDAAIPDSARLALMMIVEQIDALSKRVEKLDREIRAQATSDETSKRLMTIPGVGPMTAAAVKSHVADPTFFKSARHFSAWIGLTPKSHSSGASQTIGRISKMGNKELRAALVMGAISVLSWIKEDDTSGSWLSRLRKRRPMKVAAVALANKNARIIWTLLVRGGTYQVKPKSAVMAAIAAPTS